MTACSEDADHQPVRLEQGCSSAAMFGQEGDVVFEVGPPHGQTWRLTAHSQVLCETNDVMKAELRGPMAVARSSRNITHIRVEDVDPRAFRCMLRFLYGLPPQLQSVNTALATIYAAHKYLCADLEWECAAFLNQHVQKFPQDALDILQGAHYFCLQRDEWLPTAPPAEDSDGEEGACLMRQISSDSQTPIIVSSPPARHSAPDDELARMGDACRRLEFNCLQVIDQHADFILGLEQFEDLDQELMLAVTSRDTFAVSSELLVLVAVERWAECECKRLKLPHDPQFLREACGGQEMICSGQLARLLLLTPKEFVKVPLRSPLLTQDEQRSLLSRLVGCKGSSTPNNSPSHVAWTQLAKPRTPQPPKYLPIPASQKLGSRLPHVASETENTSRRHRRWKLPWSRVNKRKSKHETRQPKVVPETRRPTPPANDRPSCCSKTCEVFLMVVACLFD